MPENNTDAAVLGVGIDLADVARIRSMLEKYGDSFLDKTFTETEKKYCLKFSDPAIRLAARFAAKEAIVKALGTGFSGDINLKSVWVENAPSGEPLAMLSSSAMYRLQEIGGKSVKISITHLKDYAQAIAIISK